MGLSNKRGIPDMGPELLPQAPGLFFTDLVSEVEEKKLLLMNKDQSFPLPCAVQRLSHSCIAVRSTLHWPKQPELHTAMNGELCPVTTVLAWHLALTTDHRVSILRP